MMYTCDIPRMGSPGLGLAIAIVNKEGEELGGAQRQRIDE